MFSCEQKFTINGCDDEVLEKVLDLALNICGWKEIKAFYEDKNGLVFYPYECDNTTKYPFKATIPILVEQINQYIANLSNEDLERLAGKIPDIDGIVELGWEVFYPLWYGKNEIEEYDEAAILAVRPCWIVFSK